MQYKEYEGPLYIIFSTLLAAAQHPISLNIYCFSVTSVTARAAALRSHISVAKTNQTGLYCGPACGCYCISETASSACHLKYSSNGKLSLSKPHIVLGEQNYCYDFP